MATILVQDKTLRNVQPGGDNVHAIGTVPKGSTARVGEQRREKSNLGSAWVIGGQGGNCPIICVLKGEWQGWGRLAGSVGRTWEA